MRVFTMDDLTRILRECAGEDEAVDLSGDIADTSIAELGYDSLAVLETAARIEREFGVLLDDSVIAKAATPGDLVQVVNQYLIQAV
ncbi:acyl carrier protein [Nonomuraea sp. NEAU-A123]|uniref:acyl carrier protein n=1 Tax=Nonomuraea sp. NEAU-A123 TaxID=2839649 RepID=UPI001BE4632A|nr:acyl carrier protein [Nonomuraea sp. NEAU-A123]MBT2231525.1 acyl carrier protein [Nonomuraea sp. NEAU-A123]